MFLMLFMATFMYIARSLTQSIITDGKKTERNKILLFLNKMNIKILYYFRCFIELLIVDCANSKSFYTFSGEGELWLINVS